MAKVFGPLLSISASGDFGNSIQFVCGHFMRSKWHGEVKSTPDRDKQRLKFKEGVRIWGNELTDYVKKRWKEFTDIAMASKYCTASYGKVNGYNMWMFFWLKFGENGWYGYPLPPPSRTLMPE